MDKGVTVRLTEAISRHFDEWICCGSKGDGDLRQNELSCA